jgi:hypothetical protein
MALWTCNLTVCNEEIEFYAELPDSFTEQQVYDFIYEDMWLDITKGES